MEWQIGEAHRQDEALRRAGKERPGGDHRERRTDQRADQEERTPRITHIARPYEPGDADREPRGEQRQTVSKGR